MTAYLFYNVNVSNGSFLQTRNVWTCQGDWGMIRGLRLWRWSHGMITIEEAVGMTSWNQAKKTGLFRPDRLDRQGQGCWYPTVGQGFEDPEDTEIRQRRVIPTRERTRVGDYTGVTILLEHCNSWLYTLKWSQSNGWKDISCRISRPPGRIHESTRH